MKPPLLHYGGRTHYYSLGGHSHYYSRPRMSVEGKISVGSEVFEVEGSAWFDRQYGDLEAVIDRRWQWFAIQLQDNSEIMAFFFTGDRGHADDMLVMVDPDGSMTTLPAKAFSLSPIDYWQSAASGCRYPSRWRLQTGEIKLEIDPYMHDQELRPKRTVWMSPTHWQGAARVGGDRQGRAFVVLHGFCPRKDSGSN